jgi:hypothetical protein
MKIVSGSPGRTPRASRPAKAPDDRQSAVAAFERWQREGQAINRKLARLLDLPSKTGKIRN